MTNDGVGLGHSYFYDAENRIIQVNGTMGQCSTATACYVYDAQGRRVRATVNGQTRDFIYDLSGRNIDEFTPGGSGWLGTWTRGEAYAGSLHIATYANSTTEFDNSDWLSTFRARSDVTGNRIETCTSLPFGEDLTCTGTEVTPIHFTGKERDAESGNDFFGARYYTSTMGRFLTPDTKIPSFRHLSNPQKWNRYPYTINNPLRYFDPDGMEEIDVQLRSFIQQQSVSDPLGRSFAGDNRGFTSAQNVSSRTSITVRIETDASIKPGNPIVSVTPGSAGQTNMVDANGNVIKSDTAKTGLPAVSGSRDENGNAVLNFTQDTKNPLENQTLTPGIRADLYTTVAQNGSWADTNGMVSATPSFELNVGSTNIPLQTEPSGGSFGLGLWLPMGIEKFTPIMPTLDPAGVSDDDGTSQ